MGKVRSFPCAICGCDVTTENLGSLSDQSCKACDADMKEARFVERQEKRRQKLKEAQQKERQKEKKAKQAERERKIQEGFKEAEELSKQEAAKRELAHRELSRRHLLPFICRFKPNYQVGWLHKVFASELEQFYRDVLAGKQPRLMIFVPPRHGKSEIVSNNFPSWVLGHQPDWEIIMASHTIGLPLRFSRANRARIKSKEYKTLFPDTELDKDSTSAEEWLTTKRGGLKCAGVGTGISGFGANVLIIDDPIKDYQDAQSETIRETVKDWYTTTAESRLAPQGGVIVVQTRWHDDDLSGWQLRQDKDNKEAGVEDQYLQNWRVVSFPAIAESDEYIDKSTHEFFDEPGENRILVRKKDTALHPVRYSRQYLIRKKVGMPSNQWSALYQQSPVPASGEFFREEDFMYYDAEPQLHDYPVFFAWDLAIGLKRENDYTVGAAGLLVPRGGLNHLFVLDLFRNRVRDKEQIAAMVQMYLRYKRNASRFGVEHGQIWQSIEQRVKAAFEAENTTPVFDDSLRPISDKRTRATPLQGWMQNHRVWFPRHQPWTQKVKDELLRFDSGVHDDIVDALAWLTRMVENEPLIENYSSVKRGKSVKEQIEEIYNQQERDSGGGYMAA